jgi:hypothetical protein
MKSALVLTLTALLAVAGCTYKTTKVQPVAAAPAPAPTVVVAPPPQPVVVPAPAPQQVMVTYALPAGFPAAEQSAIAYCRVHYGAAGASIVTDDHAGHATFVCVS